MRKSELMELTWKDIDLRRRAITLTTTKNKDIRTVPLVGAAYDVVKDLSKVRRLDTSLLFPSGKKPLQPVDLRKAFAAALRRAEISQVSWHTLRHSSASLMLAAGASLAEIGEVLGHRTAQMSKRYAHLAENRARDTLTRMSEKFLR